MCWCETSRPDGLGTAARADYDIFMVKLSGRRSLPVSGTCGSFTATETTSFTSHMDRTAGSGLAGEFAAGVNLSAGIDAPPWGRLLSSRR